MRTLRIASQLLIQILILSAPVLNAQQHPNLERGVSAEKMYDFGEFDTVPMLNGNINFALPIGQAFPADGSLSYQLWLSHNSKLWDFFQETNPPFPEGDGATVTRGRPAQGSNAGFGWVIGFGRIIDPDDPMNDSFGSWLYESPDGGAHQFFNTLHTGGPTSSEVFYTRDGSYLRLTQPLANIREVHFPDGTIHRFVPDGAVKWKLAQIHDSHRDSFGQPVNYVIFTPLSSNANCPGANSVLKISDKFGREQFVCYQNKSLNGQTTPFVERAVLTAFGSLSAKATYRFEYLDGAIPYPCPHHPYPGDPYVEVPLLRRIILPDNSFFEFDYFPETAPCDQGTVKAVKLPTGGKIKYTYQTYAIPVAACSEPGVYARTSTGIATRSYLDANNNEIGTWEYLTELSPQVDISRNCADPGEPLELAPRPHEYMKNTVITPEEDRINHFFSVWSDYDPSPNGAITAEITLPYTRGRFGDPEASPSGPPYLTKLTKDCDDFGGSCTNARADYIEMDVELGFASNAAEPGVHRRVKTSKTVHHFQDSFGTWTQHWSESRSSNFDGLGHYRRTDLDGDFTPDVPSMNKRTVFRNYNPTAGIFPGTFQQPLPTQPWILETYTEECTRDGDITSPLNQCYGAGGNVAMTQFCFDPNTAFLKRRRTMRTTVPNAYDLLAVFKSDESIQMVPTGNVREEHYFGGDLQAVDTVLGLCDLAPPAHGLHSYQIDHSYSYGSLATSSYGLGFLSVDRSIDQWTGLTASSRDTAGLATTYNYDSLGRVTAINAQPGQDANFQVTHTPAAGSTPAQTHIAAKSNNFATTLAEQRVFFDPFGRRWRESHKLPDGSWNMRETQFSASGLKKHVTEIFPENLITSATRTSFSYDPFGRPRVITPPDGVGNNILLNYEGTRKVRRTEWRASGFDGSGNIIPAWETRSEEFDRHGRLYRVYEPGPTEDAITQYQYDVGDRLSSSCMYWNLGCQQWRLFSYDNRGFLVTETHPENGSTLYSNYDARGHFTRRRVGAVNGEFDLSFVYDRAERLTSVSEAGGQQRLLKSFEYATANDGEWKKGKLRKQIRYNYPERADIKLELGEKIRVEETFVYTGKGGRISEVFLGIDDEIGPGYRYDFITRQIYTDLGDVASIDYPDCSFSMCLNQVSTNPLYLFNLSHNYTNGYLTSVPNFATLSYNPSGTVHTVAHTNGVSWTQTPHWAFRSRPGKIETTGASANWSTGDYVYDGRGDVAKMGVDYFVYDKKRRLTQGTAGRTASTEKRQNYGFDGFGNLISVTTYLNGTPTFGASYPTNTANNRLTSGSYGDGGGNLTGWGGITFNYDSFNMLTELKDLRDYAYLYSATDERVQEYDLNTNTSYFRIRGLDNKILRNFRQDKSSGEVWTLTKDWIWRDGLILATSKSTEKLHFDVDHLGTPRLITRDYPQSPGQVFARHDYYPFGEEATTTTQDQETLKLTGHQRDFCCNGSSEYLDYMHARYLNPMMGRFLSVDPVINFSRVMKNPQGWNRYAYVSNNPINKIDPDGRDEYTMDQRLSGIEDDWQRDKVQLRQILSIMASAAGTAGDIYDVFSAAIGRDVIAGTSLSGGERILGAALPLAGVGVMRTANAGLTALNKSIASQAQLRDAMQGIGSVIAGAGAKKGIDDLPRLLKQHGGDAGDWVKKSTSAYKAGDGTSISIHWYENTRTGKRVEFKTNIDELRLRRTGEYR